MESEYKDVRERLEARRRATAAAAPPAPWKRELFIDTKLDRATKRREAHIEEVKRTASKLAQWRKDVRSLLHAPAGTGSAPVGGGGGPAPCGEELYPSPGSDMSASPPRDGFARLAAAASPPSAEELRSRLEGAEKKRLEYLHQRAHASALHNVTTRVRSCIHRRKRARHLATVKRGLDASLRAAAARRDEALKEVQRRAHAQVVRAEARARQVRSARKIVRWAKSLRSMRSLPAGASRGALRRSLESVRVAARVARLFRTRAVQQSVATIAAVVVREADALGASFEACASAIQRRALVAAAQTLLQGVVRARDIMDPALRATAGSCTKSGLRPLVARSSRTLLAALMVVHFPGEILESWEGDTSDSAAERALVDHAHRVVAALRSICGRAAGEDAAPVDLDLAEAVLAFNATWCEYMDAFMVWKHGDGMRLAQALAGTFRELCATEHRYEREYATDIGREDEGLEQLRRGLAGQFVQIRKQLVSLLGDRKAGAWEREQRAAVRKALEKRAAVAADRTAAGRDAARATKRTRSPAGPSSTAAAAAAGVDDSTAEGAGETKDASEPHAASSPSRSSPGGPRSPPNVAASPGKMRLMKQVFSNAALAHQILLHPDTRLPEPDMPLEAAALLGGGGGGGGGGSGGGGSEPMPELSLGASALPDAAAPAASERSCSIHSSSERPSPGAGRPTVAVARPFAGPAPEVARQVAAELDAIVAGLVECVPHRRDLHARIRDRLDRELHFNSISRGHMGWAGWRDMLQYLAATVGELEAPDRAEDTAAWVAATTATLTAEATRGPAAMDPDTGGSLPVGLRELLPGVFAWVHFKLKQIRVDVANFHISTLGPYLRRNGMGADFERKRFSDALARGDAALDHTVVWLRDAARRLREALEAKAPAAAGALADRIRRDDQQVRMSVMREGLLALLARPRALVHDAASAGGRPGPVPSPEAAFPETLAMDAKQLTIMQSELQRVALVLSLSALVQQAVSMAKPPAGPGSSPGAPAAPRAPDGAARRTLASLPGDLYTILQDEGNVSVGNLEEAAVAVARDVAASAGKELTDAGAATLRKAVAGAVDVDHKVYAIFQSRVLGYVRGSMGAALRSMRHSDADRVVPVPEWEAALCPVPRTPLHPTVLKAVAKMGAELARLARHSDNVFGASHYAGLYASL